MSDTETVTLLKQILSVLKQILNELGSMSQSR